MAKTSIETKARQYLAKFHSFSNAAEFIRQHGEEGFSFNDEKLNEKYMKQNEKTASMLERKADYWHIKYKETGISLDCSSFFDED